jgi:shikimate dehydrogenase
MPKLAVLGRPVAHSRSPAMQNAALAELGLAPEWSYEAIEVAPEDFEVLVRSLPERGFAGVNVTLPHKLAALALADTATDAAREIGAANVLTFDGGAIAAQNTDCDGVTGALPVGPRGKRSVVLGAGGSARAAVWALKRAGAEVEVWNRSPEKAERLAAELGVAVRTEDHPLGAGDYDVLVNCTTVGLAEAERPPSGDPDLKGLPLDADSLGRENVVVDMVYGPYPTPLARLANERGATVEDGLEVLVHQGAASLRIWTGLEPPVETMRRAARG